MLVSTKTASFTVIPFKLLEYFPNQSLVTDVHLLQQFIHVRKMYEYCTDINHSNTHGCSFLFCFCKINIHEGVKDILHVEFQIQMCGPTIDFRYVFFLKVPVVQLAVNFLNILRLIFMLETCNSTRFDGKFRCACYSRLDLCFVESRKKVSTTSSNIKR